MRVLAILAVAIGVGIVVYAFLEADLGLLLAWWLFGTTQPPASLALPITLGIFGGVIIAGGVTLWKKADENE